MSEEKANQAHRDAFLETVKISFQMGSEIIRLGNLLTAIATGGKLDIATHVKDLEAFQAKLKDYQESILSLAKLAPYRDFLKGLEDRMDNGA